MVKKILTVSLAVLMIAGPAVAVDHIGIFADLSGATHHCVVPPDFAPFSVYVVHLTNGTTGSQFKVVNSSGYSLSASVLNGYLAIGDAFTNLSLAYGGCLAGPAVAAVQLSGFGFPVPGLTCGLVEVVPVLGKPYIIAVNCNFAEIAATGGLFAFNPDEICPFCIVATEESTWGKVKSLYR